MTAVGKIGDRVQAMGAAERRRRRARYLIARAAADLVSDRIKSGHGGRLDALSDAILSGDMSPTSAAADLLKD